MGTTQSLAEQLGWCVTTQDYLNDLNVDLKWVAEHYQQSVDNLKTFGYLEELMPHFESLCSEFESSIDGVVGYIESEHIEYIHGRSVTIQEVLSKKFG